MAKKQRTSSPRKKEIRLAISTSSNANHNTASEQSQLTSPSLVIHNPKKPADVFHNTNRSLTSTLSDDRTFSVHIAERKTAPISAAISSFDYHGNTESRPCRIPTTPIHSITTAPPLECSSQSTASHTLSDISLQPATLDKSFLRPTSPLQENLSNVFGPSSKASQTNSLASSSCVQSTAMSTTNSLCLTLRTAKTALREPVLVLSGKVLKQPKDKDSRKY